MIYFIDLPQKVSITKGEFRAKRKELISNLK